MSIKENKLKQIKLYYKIDSIVERDSFSINNTYSYIFKLNIHYGISRFFRDPSDFHIVYGQIYIWSIILPHFTFMKYIKIYRYE